MSAEILCYRCGASLKALTLPLSRRDECPECSVSLHVCRMCRFFDPTVPRQCREDDAEEVLDKLKVNFCEWFAPAADAFDPRGARAEVRAKSELAALFGDGDGAEPREDDLLRRVKELFGQG